MKFRRRRFLQHLCAAAAALSAGRISAIPAGDRHHRIIPKSGEAIPAVGLGSWLGGPLVERVLDRALG